MTDIWGDRILDMMRGYREEQIATAMFVAACLCDLPDAEKRIQVAIDSAAKMEGDARMSRKRGAELPKLARQVGQTVQGILTTAVESNGIEWPIREKAA